MPWMSGPKIVEELWLSQKLSWCKHSSGFFSLKDGSSSANKDAKSSSTPSCHLGQSQFSLNFRRIFTRWSGFAKFTSNWCQELSISHPGDKMSWKTSIWETFSPCSKLVKQAIRAFYKPSFSELESEPDRFINKLLSLNPNSTLAQLANGAFVWHSAKNPLEASKILLAAIEKTPNPNFFGVLILCHCLFDIKVILFLFILACDEATSWPSMNTTCLFS